MRLSKTRLERIGLIIRALLSLALILGLVRYIGASAILTELGALRASTLAIIVSVFASNILFVTPRWAVILNTIGYRIRSSALVGSVFLGFFFNQLLPTAVGGDALRVWRARQLGVPWEVALHSVLIDRGAGVFTALIGAAVLLPLADSTAVNNIIGSIVAIFAAAIGAGGLILYLMTKFGLFSRLGNLSKICETLSRLAHHPKAVGAVLGLSLPNQMISVLVVWLLARELNVSLPLIDAALVTFVVTIASVLPISFAGWGVREGALVYLLAAFGIPHSTAFSISILFGMCLTLSSAPGIFAIGQLWGRQSSPRISRCVGRGRAEGKQ